MRWVRPEARLQMALALPLLPTAMTFSRRSTYSQRASSSTNVLLSDGSARKSKQLRLLTAGNLASLIFAATLYLLPP